MLVKAVIGIISFIFSVQLMAQGAVILADDDPAPFPWSQCLLEHEALVGVWGYDLDENDQKFIIINQREGHFWLNISILNKDNKELASGIGLLLDNDMKLFANMKTPDGSPMHLTIKSYCDQSGSRKLMNARIEYFHKHNTALDYTLRRVKEL